MDAPMNEQRIALLSRIKESLVKVESNAARIKRSNTRLLYSSLVASAIATALAGLTAAIGPLAGQGASAWKITCGAVAVLTGFSGLFTGIHQKFSISEKLARAMTCAGRLRALEIALSITLRDPIEVAKEYEELSANYQEILI